MLGRAIIINLDNNEPAAATVVGTTSKGFPKRGRHQRGRNLRGHTWPEEMELELRVCHVVQL